MNNQSLVNNIFEYSYKLSRMRFKRRMILSFLGAFFISFSFYILALCIYKFGETAGSILGAALFPLAIYLTLCFGGNLLPTNSIMFLSITKKKMKIMLFVRELAITWFFNLIGSFFTIFLTIFLIRNKDFENVVSNMAATKMNSNIFSIIIGSFICNILVSLSTAINCSNLEKVQKFPLIYMIIFVFALGNFQHTVANQYIEPLGIIYNFHFLKTSNEFLYNESQSWFIFFLIHQPLNIIFNTFGTVFFIYLIISINKT